VFSEAYRVLKPGGRLAVSDVVLVAELPDNVKNDMACHTGCIAGAATVATLEAILAQVGFTRVQITVRPESREFIRHWMPGTNIEEYVVAAAIEAEKS